MNMVRTTVSLPEPILKQWKIEAVRRGITLGDVILSKTGTLGKTRLNTQEKIAKDFALFDEIAKKSGKFDAVAAVREERNRDDY